MVNAKRWGSISRICLFPHERNRYQTLLRLFWKQKINQISSLSVCLSHTWWNFQYSAESSVEKKANTFTCPLITWVPVWEKKYFRRHKKFNYWFLSLRESLREFKYIGRNRQRWPVSVIDGLCLRDMMAAHLSEPSFSRFTEYYFSSGLLEWVIYNRLLLFLESVGGLPEYQWKPRVTTNAVNMLWS